MKECEICVFKFSEIGQKIRQYPLFSGTIYKTNVLFNQNYISFRNISAISWQLIPNTTSS
jgi:hypothetical protein